MIEKIAVVVISYIAAKEALVLAGKTLEKNSEWVAINILGK